MLANDMEVYIMLYLRLTIVSILIILLALFIPMYSLPAAEWSSLAVFTADELSSLTSQDIDEIYIQFFHRWGRANRIKSVFIAGAGELFLSDWQDGGWIKESIMTGKASAEEFTELEYQMVMRDNVEYSIIQKGQIDAEQLKSLIDIIADNVEIVYPQGIGSFEYADEAINFNIAKGEHAICIHETPNVSYNNPARLEILYQIEGLIDNILSSIDLSASDGNELAEFERAHANRAIREANIAQEKLGGGYDDYHYGSE